ncbi:MAG: cyclopropane-fatty-acyl-phospholipid synthase family protein [Acidimicrobiales bacterium]
MASITPEDEERFGTRYRTSGSSALIDAEMEVLGSDYQANGYTTRAQAQELADVLRLESGHRLLDIGAGCGWPGLYLATLRGCAVVGIDPVTEGVAAAVERARRDGLTDRYVAARGSGAALPFGPRSFDAVVHSDVTC